MPEQRGSEPRRRVLLLGGTREGVQLARALATEPDIETIYSLAGHTRRPAPVPGEVRTGGFGGVEGLVGYLAEAGIDLVVDATHPYAEEISAHAVTACKQANVPRLVLHRPPWRPDAGDRWFDAPDAAAAARMVPEFGERALLAIGSRDLDAFAQVQGVRFIVRVIEPPALALAPERFDMVYARGPFPLDEERELLRSRAIEVVVAKNSGLAPMRAKLDAARELGLPAILLARPPAPPGPRVETVADACAWVRTGGRGKAVSRKE